LNREKYWQSICVIFQDFLRYEGSLQENIALSKIYTNQSSKEIAAALKKAQVDFLLKKGCYKSNQNLGNWFEEGRQLFDGQWQKIGLARIFYKDASLYLLDEPTSSIDSFSEKKIFENFFLRKDKIIIFITHNLSMAKKADKVLLLKNGKVHGFENSKCSSLFR
jgi:ABC-type multidrug transport system fused ATPase/permease subunit